jgi:hypothetical protein
MVLLLTATVAVVPGFAAGTRTGVPRDLGRFMWGLAGQESGWDYFARNRYSGAFGKYQIMPVNWPGWASTYAGDRWADQSPEHQERVARGKLVDLHRWLGSWRRVAYWWLTGDTETDADRWSSLARGYVRNVLTLMKRAPDGASRPPSGPATDGRPADRGDWRLASRGTVLWDGTDRRRRPVGWVRDGQVLFVQASQRRSSGVLWMRVSTAGDRVGWLSIRRTLPTHRPDNARTFPRGTGGDDGPATQRGERERARPRPR